MYQIVVCSFFFRQSDNRMNNGNLLNYICKLAYSPYSIILIWRLGWHDYLARMQMKVTAVRWLSLEACVRNFNREWSIAGSWFEGNLLFGLRKCFPNRILVALEYSSAAVPIADECPISTICLNVISKSRTAVGYFNYCSGKIFRRDLQH